jgi:hypothetical protein
MLLNLLLLGFDDAAAGKPPCGLIFNEPARSLYYAAYSAGETRSSQ